MELRERERGRREEEQGLCPGRGKPQGRQRRVQGARAASG
jgi:hypothetical protein